MPVSMITISKENIVELAQNAIKPMKCDWMTGRESCPVVLGCWALLKEHLHRHCSAQKKQPGGYVCGLPRCNMRHHTSTRSLKSHVELAHLQRAHVPCPISECTGISFPLSRRNLLLDHFKTLHDRLEGKVVACPTALLHPVWRPFFPAHPIPDPPSLPQHNPPPGTTLIPSVATPETKTDLMKQAPVLKQSMQGLQSRRRHQQASAITMGNSASSHLSFGEDTRKASSQWDFDPLPRLLEADLTAVTMVIQPIASHKRDLVRPQVMQSFELLEVLPQSIHYERDSIFCTFHPDYNRNYNKNSHNIISKSTILCTYQQTMATTQIEYNSTRAAIPHEGRRVARRKDNARFADNPHIVPATRLDYSIPPPSAKSTFPAPLPTYLPRTVIIPTASLPARDPITANAGRFSLSLKGMRRELRRAGHRIEVLVGDIEHELIEWLSNIGGCLQVSEPSSEVQGQRRVIGKTGSIVEVSRTPLELVWAIADDAFARYIVHCCARYYEIVSFSKDSNGERLTHLLRPNVTRPDHRASATLDTPPATDIDSAYSSQVDTETDTDFDASQSDAGESDAESASAATQSRPLLPAISEDSGLFRARPSLRQSSPDGQMTEDADMESEVEENTVSTTHFRSLERNYLRDRASVALSPLNRPDRTHTNSFRIHSTQRSLYAYLFL
ncbi:hypothetical protein AX16_005189 [Volvariella volvacea WC 439]|nr:hypothetical protein AX16_005189 [Volvariella volvacea WC 439]